MKKQEAIDKLKHEISYNKQSATLTPSYLECSKFEAGLYATHCLSKVKAYEDALNLLEGITEL